MSFWLAALTAGFTASSRAQRAPEVATSDAPAGASGDAPAAAPFLFRDGDPRDPDKSQAVGAVLRRRDGLMPADPAFDVFVRWWTAQSGPLEDAEELLAQWAWLESHRAHPAPDAVPPDLVTVVPAAAAAPVDNDTPPASVAPPPATPVTGGGRLRTVPGRRKLRASEAAERFVDWIRLCGRAGLYNSDQLSALYLEHCRAEDLVALHDSVLRPELQQLPGVIKQQSSEIYLRKGGKRDRRRQYLWTILAEPEATVAETASEDADAVPFDLPVRRVA